VLLGDHEGHHVYLPEGSLADDRVVRHTIVLLVVGGKVLDASSDAAVLDAVDVRGGNSAGEVGVFGEGLEGATAEGVALGVAGGAEPDGGGL